MTPFRKFSNPKNFKSPNPLPFTRVHFVSHLSDIVLPSSCVIICDQNLSRAIPSQFSKSIFCRGGEKLKTFSSIEKLALKVLQKNPDRFMSIVAIGGGSIGDAAGFLASILWRGTGLIHVPTTLLSMVDSSHGGKTGINLPQAKNQLGTFYPAQAVWIVNSILQSLPPQVLRDGWAELIKTALIGEPRLAAQLFRQEVNLRPPSLNTLRKIISVKQRICIKDPFEIQGHREILNFGHTLGHALEINSTLSHGQAVAWGLCVACWISQRFGFSDFEKVFQWIKPLLRNPTRWPNDNVLEKSLRLDKKQKNQQFRSIVLSSMGKPMITNCVSPKDWIKGFHEIQKKF